MERFRMKRHPNQSPLVMSRERDNSPPRRRHHSALVDLTLPEASTAFDISIRITPQQPRTNPTAIKEVIEISSASNSSSNSSNWSSNSCHCDSDSESDAAAARPVDASLPAPLDARCPLCAVALTSATADAHVNACLDSGQPLQHCPVCQTELVAATANQHVENCLSASESSPVSKSQHICVVCFEAPIDMCCYPCRHAYLCSTCQYKVFAFARNQNCVSCRQPVQRLYAVNHSKVRKQPIFYPD